MSNIATREPWRDHSIISSAVKATIQGLGWRSYTAGLDALIGLVREMKEEAKARRGAAAKDKSSRKR
jgi:3-dehydroquinate dehydratase-2